MRAFSARQIAVYSLFDCLAGPLVISVNFPFFTTQGLTTFLFPLLFLLRDHEKLTAFIVVQLVRRFSWVAYPSSFASFGAAASSFSTSRLPLRPPPLPLSIAEWLTQRRIRRPSAHCGHKCTFWHEMHDPAPHVLPVALKSTLNRLDHTIVSIVLVLPKLIKWINEA